MFRAAAGVIMSLSLYGLPAYAADADSQKPTAAPAAAERTGSVPALAGDVDWSLPPVQIGPAKRPGALPALYGSLAAFEIFDAYATSQGLARGAREINPLMQGAVGSPAVFWAFKAATAAAPMLLAERMWRKNRVGAIVVMTLANGVVAAVAANNARVLRQQR